MSCNCLAPDAADNWRELASANPRNPLDIIANATLNGNTVLFLNSTTFATPPSVWHAAGSPVALTANPTDAALGSDQQINVANANQWQFKNPTWNSDTKIAPETQRRQWNSCNRSSTANGYSSKRRYYGNAIILPDMTVMLVGGINSTYPPKDVDGVLEIEFYDHFASNPRWSVLKEPKLKYPRNYHSNAILLYDGRVLICDSNVNAAADDDGTVDMGNRIMAFEIYTPEYLLKGIGPEFRIPTARVKYGDRIIIELLNKWRWGDINSNKIVLIRLYAVTHAFANDQRCVVLKAVSTASSNNPPMLTDSTFAIRIPSDTDNPKGRYLLPPGPYMVFLSSITGAVSKSFIIFIE
ncbi:MAG: DUF1929 domain-containing protein [Chlorobi bacterium]|nr:DUF1929 domain-containing protein [Chlorobiota bacterium]